MPDAARPVLGFDVGATSIRGVVYADVGDAPEEPVAKRQADSREVRTPDALAGRLVEMSRTLLDATDADDTGEQQADDLSVTLGVALAAQLDASGEVVRNSPNFGWRDVEFAKVLSEAWSGDRTARIQLFNDVDAVLYGESSAGALTDASNALAVMVGSGVGGAMLIDGRLYTGAGNHAGEIGHSKVVPGGRRCGCGQRGCLEAYAGGIHLERRLEEILGEEIESLERADAMAAEGLEDLPDTVGRLWRRATDFLAVVTANACTLLNPESLLIGGGVLESCDAYRRAFLSKLTPLVGEVAAEDLEIVSPDLGDWSGAVGAARLAISESAT